jgi:RHS repeat-associated protein
MAFSGPGLSDDADNRLVEVANSADPDDTTFVYSADGARIKRAHGDEATYYIGPIEIETNQGDVTETHTIYSLGGGVNAVRVVASPGDDGEVTFTFGDHLGSSSTVWQAGELGDTDPGVTSFQRYYPYGEPRDDYSPALPTDHTFTGQISDGLLDDGGTGLMYYRARYYDPQVGRFAAADTIVPDRSNPQDLNRYTYVGNNPINAIDPSGHRYIETGTGRDYWGARGNGPPALAWRIFNDMADEQDILFQYLPKGCEDRAEQMADLIADEYPDVILNKVGIARDPGEKSLVVTIITNEGPYGGPYDRPFRWRYHMAVEVEIGGETWVIDPSLFDEPVSEAQWAAVMGAVEVEVETLPISIYNRRGGTINGSEVYVWSPTQLGEEDLLEKVWGNREGNLADACITAEGCELTDAQMDLREAYR